MIYTGTGTAGADINIKLLHAALPRGGVAAAPVSKPPQGRPTRGAGTGRHNQARRRPLAQQAPAGSTGAQQAIGMPLTGQVWPQWLHHGKSNEATGGWNPFQAELSW